MAGTIQLSSSEKLTPKYRQLLDTAEDLFLRYGIKRVTVEEICQTANVSKMTFYKHFKNKNALALRLIINILDEGQAAFDNIMSQTIPFNEKIKQFIQLKLDYGKRFSKEFYQDFIGYSPEIRKFVMERSQQGMNQMLDIFKNAQQKGEVRKDLNLKLLSYLLDLVLEIREDPRLVSIYPDMYDFTRDWMNFFFYGIMGTGKPGND